MPSTPPSTPPGVGVLGRATAAIAGASARRPKTVIVLWLVLIAGLVFAGTTVGTKSLTEAQSGVGESAKAQALLDRADLRDPAVESVLVRSGDRATTAKATADITRRAEKLPEVASVRGPQDVQVPLHRGREDHIGPGHPARRSR